MMVLSGRAFLPFGMRIYVYLPFRHLTATLAVERLCGVREHISPNRVSCRSRVPDSRPEVNSRPDASVIGLVGGRGQVGIMANVGRAKSFRPAFDREIVAEITSQHAVPCTAH